MLEHVPDDLALLKDYVGLAPDSAKFVITVPAFMSLWSGHDVYLKHFRRYRIKELIHLAEHSGLKVLKAQYLYTSLFPLAWIYRQLPKSKEKKSQLKETSKIVTIAMRSILWLDYLPSKFLPFGISIPVMAEKP